MPETFYVSYTSTKHHRHICENQQMNELNCSFQAGDCYKNVNADQSIAAFRAAVGEYSENARWNQCGNLMKSIAEMCNS